MMKSFTVSQDENKQRLDLFLAFKLPEYSRSQIRRQLNNGVVKIGDEIVYKPNYRVKTGEIIAIDTQAFAEEQPEILPENIPLDIIYEDKDLVVINKPAGMVVHPATANWQGTLMNALLYKYQGMRKVGDTKLRFGLIHRLDKDTSGLILIGKTNFGLWHYSKLFAERKLEKIYLAVVAGDMSKVMQNKAYVVRDYLGRNPKNRQKISIVAPEKSGKIAETKFIFVKNLKINGRLCSLVKALPKTGRTHQIRVHLSNLGYPIMGDKVYGRGNTYDRLLLHAWRIKLPLPSAKRVTFEAPVPHDFSFN